MAKFKFSDVRDVYFNLNGRLGRGDFWAYGVPLSLVGFLVIAGLGLSQSLWAGLASLAVYAVFLWAYAGLLVKRGHDRNRPAVLSILVLAARVILALIGGFLGSSPLILGLQAALIIYVFIDYAAMPGAPGPNRYGPWPGGPGIGKPLVLGAEEATEATALPASPPKA
jgi:uncharacterized membrane protein YhaH (DUF805 family)